MRTFVKTIKLYFKIKMKNFSLTKKDQIQLVNILVDLDLSLNINIHKIKAIIQIVEPYLEILFLDEKNNSNKILNVINQNNLFEFKRFLSLALLNFQITYNNHKIAFNQEEGNDGEFKMLNLNMFEVLFLKFSNLNLIHEQAVYYFKFYLNNKNNIKTEMQNDSLFKLNSNFLAFEIKEIQKVLNISFYLMKIFYFIFEFKKDLILNNLKKEKEKLVQMFKLKCLLIFIKEKIEDLLTILFVDNNIDSRINNEFINQFNDKIKKFNNIFLKEISLIKNEYFNKLNLEILLVKFKYNNVENFKYDFEFVSINNLLKNDEFLLKSESIEQKITRYFSEITCYSNELTMASLLFDKFTHFETYKELENLAETNILQTQEKGEEDLNYFNCANSILNTSFPIFIKEKLI